MSLEYQSKLNQLLVLGKKNGLFFSDWLRKKGYSDQLIRKYRQSGWLATLDTGIVCCDPSKQTDCDGPL